MATERVLQAGQPVDALSDNGIGATATIPPASTMVEIEEVATRLRATVESWTAQERYAARYAQFAMEHDSVAAVYADTTHGLTLYTVYRGDRHSIAPVLYASYQRVIDEYPDVPADFRLVDHSRLDMTPLPLTARPLFSEA